MGLLGIAVGSRLATKGLVDCNNIMFINSGVMIIWLKESRAQLVHPSLEHCCLAAFWAKDFLHIGFCNSIQQVYSEIDSMIGYLS